MRTIAIIILLLIPIKLGAETPSLDTKVRELWWNTEGSTVIAKCNKYAKDSKHCKIVHSFVAKAESNLCKDAQKHNCYGNSKYKFATNEEAHTRFNKTYNQYYYKNLKPNDFYPAKPGDLPKTRYCMSEESSNSPNSCPNGNKTARTIYNSLINLK